MHSIGPLALGFGSWACFGGLPTILTILACIDIYRRGERWWWYPIVFFFPWFGSIGYFVVTRGPWRLAADLGASRDRRRRAEARLRDLDTQLAHWRGPAVLAEAGEELLILGRHAEARDRLVEARKAGASVEDVNLGLAETLVALQMHEEAVPVLEELLLMQPDAGLGRARILLARCLEALNRNVDAERAWRLLLERRNEPEAQARLARLLLLRCETEEASSLAQVVVADAKLVGVGLRRRRQPWVRLARQVTRGRAAKVPGHAERGAMRRWIWIVAIAALLILLGIVAIGILVVLPLYREIAAAAQQAEIHGSATARVIALDVTRPWTRGTDQSVVVVEPDDVEAWLHARLEWDRLHSANLAAAGDATGEKSVLDRIGIPVSMMRSEQRLERMDAQSLADVLTHSGLGPEAFAQLVGIIEGRFLGRAEAVGYVLPASFRPAWSATWRRTTIFAADGDPSGGNESLEGFLTLASSQKALDPRTRTLLETRRADLERVDPASLPAALHVIVGAANQARYLEATGQDD